jgi:hypothetical protein
MQRSDTHIDELNSTPVTGETTRTGEKNEDFKDNCKILPESPYIAQPPLFYAHFGKV